MSHQTHEPDDDRTIPTRKFAAFPEAADSHRDDAPAETPHVMEATTRPLPPSAPWLLQQHFTHQIDLGAELAFRYPTLPIMSISRFRSLDARRGVAFLSTADGMAAFIIEADGVSGLVDLAFSFAATLTLRFRLDHLSALDRTNWLERMRRDKDSAAFLWGESRWEKDYAISIQHKHFVNLYAFSQQNFDAAARLTPDVATKLLDWLAALWQPDDSDTQPPQMLTW